MANAWPVYSKRDTRVSLVVTHDPEVQSCAPCIGCKTRRHNASNDSIEREITGKRRSLIVNLSIWYDLQYMCLYVGHRSRAYAWPVYSRRDTRASPVVTHDPEVLSCAPCTGCKTRRRNASNGSVGRGINGKIWLLSASFSIWYAAQCMSLFEGRQPKHAVATSVIVLWEEL